MTKQTTIVVIDSLRVKLPGSFPTDRFQGGSSVVLFCAWLHIWRMYCTYLFLISPFGAAGGGGGGGVS